jgi:hypothetical protein
MSDNRPDPPVDPRGVRFAAAVTAVVLALVLLTGSVWLLAAQVTVFALAAFAGLRFTPYTVAFRLLVAPRIGPPTAREDPAQRSRWPPLSSTPPSASAWAASCTG